VKIALILEALLPSTDGGVIYYCKVSDNIKLTYGASTNIELIKKDQAGTNLVP